MTNEQILKKAVEKAIKCGMCKYLALYRKWAIGEQDLLENEEYYKIIFSHDFAKAFWGEEKVVYMQIVGGDPRCRWKAYEYHLMRMVLEEEPLKYLEKLISK